MGSKALADLRFLAKEQQAHGGLLLVGEVADSLPVEQHSPEPWPDCGVCSALADQREAAAQEADERGAYECNREILNHPHEGERT
ncbi:hypothetical protein [Streptomyces sp. NPDC051561]|uniref:hypothetical protein n=1 Tax=Streptomyces sp. NPDC051561 TaxID=3365658 RepID=UPI00379C7C60